jgi:hypothetical protein
MPGQVPHPRSRREVPAPFDAILADAGITFVLSGIPMPRMNSIMERWIQTCRHELLVRTLIWNLLPQRTSSAKSAPRQASSGFGEGGTVQVAPTIDRLTSDHAVSRGS